MHSNCTSLANEFLITPVETHKWLQAQNSNRRKGRVDGEAAQVCEQKQLMMRWYLAVGTWALSRADFLVWVGLVSVIYAQPYTHAFGAARISTLNDSRPGLKVLAPYLLTPRKRRSARRIKQHSLWVCVNVSVELLAWTGCTWKDRRTALRPAHLQWSGKTCSKITSERLHSRTFEVN